MLTSLGMGFFLYLGQEIEGHYWQHDQDSQYLLPVGLMVVENDADDHCQDLSAWYRKGHEMLFELLDHTADEELASARQHQEGEQVDSNEGVLEQEDGKENIYKLARRSAIEMIERHLLTICIISMGKGLQRRERAGKEADKFLFDFSLSGFRVEELKQ